MGTTNLKGSPGFVTVPNPTGSLRLGKASKTIMSPPDEKDTL